MVKPDNRPHIFASLMPQFLLPEYPLYRASRTPAGLPSYISIRFAFSNYEKIPASGPACRFVVARGLHP
ncbi:MAG TPA: hypothetical protein PKL15_03685, partial [Saprospiraceae bacterium]|nr:hypothetical protein [Saprospiraceae bacterium]